MKKFLICFFVLFCGQILFAAVPNNVIPVTIERQMSNGLARPIVCTGMRLSEKAIITAAHCVSFLSTVDTDIYIDLKYHKKANSWGVSISTFNGPAGAQNGRLYLYKQNYNRDIIKESGNRDGDFALIVINHPRSILENIEDFKNMQNISEQYRKELISKIKATQKEINSQYNKFMKVPLEKYKLFAVNTKNNGIYYPKSFTTMTVNSFLFPLDKDDPQFCDAPIVHTGKFKGFYKKNPTTTFGWDLFSCRGESGSPIIDTKSKRVFGVLSGGVGQTINECGNVSVTMIIDENVCSFLKKNAGVKCEIANPYTNQ